jgi:hypothetical protein
VSKATNRTKRLLAAGLALALVVSAEVLRADGVDPRVPLRIVTGRPRPAFEFSQKPAIAWQARLLEPILGAPVADENALVVAHASGLVVELDANGRTRRTVRAGSSLALGPVLLASRRRMVVTADAEAVILLPSGRIESKQKLSFRELDSSAIAIATSDGGALIGAGARFARIGPTGSLTALGSSRETLRGLFEWHGLAILVERGGLVLGLGHAGDPFEVANLGRSVRACELQGDRLLSLVGDRELVEVDLDTRAERTLWSDPPLVPRGVFVLPNGEVRLVASAGLVVALDTAGRETFRVTQPGASAEASVTLVGDSRGATLVATGGLDLRLVGATGDIVEIPATACPDPLRPTPFSSGAGAPGPTREALVVASCRSGLLFGISGKAH